MLLMTEELEEMYTRLCSDTLLNNVSEVAKKEGTTDVEVLRAYIKCYLWKIMRRSDEGTDSYVDKPRRKACFSD